VNALGLPRSADLDPLEQVVEALNRQPSLLVLDNLEHLVEEGALLVKMLLERIPALACLVTSRQRLSLAGEQELAVLPLPTPKRSDSPERLLQYASVKLFVDRAQAVRADFQVTAANAGAIAALCDQLEGLPLALELAAARVGVLTPQQMLTHVEKRFGFLVSRQRGAPSRHRTLRGAIDWSYQLLSLELQQFFARLSVFRGGWTLAAAVMVCEEPMALEYMEQLRSCSLILAEELGAGDGDGTEMRFRMLETLREYGQEQLAPLELAALARRHMTYYLTLAEQAAPQRQGPDHRQWLGRIEEEHQNLRAALRWSVESGEAETGLRLAGAVWQYWETRGFWAEGRERVAELLSLPFRAPRTAARAAALHGAGALASDQGDYAAARSLLEQSLEIWRELQDLRGIASSLHLLGIIARHQGDYGAARDLYEESLAIRRTAGDKPGVLFSLRHLGVVFVNQGDRVAARACLQEALGIARDLGDPLGITEILSGLGSMALDEGDCGTARAFHEESLAIRRRSGDLQNLSYSLNSLANVSYCQGDLAEARALFEESLEIQRQLGDKRGVAWSIHSLGAISLTEGEFRAARDLFAESLAIRQTLGDQVGIAECLQGLAEVDSAQGQPERAARLFGAAASLRDALGVPLQPHQRADYDRRVHSTRVALGEELFTADWSEGRAMTHEQAVAYALQSSNHY
jgi:predicted ATPase